MKILIIGGTKFLGRHLTDAALKNNHEVTLFNRGKFSNQNFENVEQIHGDRNLEPDLEKLAGRRWDAVIDTCGYLPQKVKMSAAALQNSAGQYIFISSISAYADFSRPNFEETAEEAILLEGETEKIEKIDLRKDLSAAVLGESYGPLKVLCEHEVKNAFPGKNLIVRPGLIVGEFDPTDRFTYWVMRVAKGGPILTPGKPDRFVQIIDARDLAAWIIEMAEKTRTGVYNVTGRPFELTFGKMLEEIKNVSRSDAKFVWVDEDFIKRENVSAWGEMPLYLSESKREIQGFLSVNIDQATSEGLKFHPLGETIRKTLDWRKTVTNDLKAGLSSERESELLDKWRKSKEREL